jgi:hypothetical protein
MFNFPVSPLIFMTLSIHQMEVIFHANYPAISPNLGANPWSHGFVTHLNTGV